MRVPAYPDRRFASPPTTFEEVDVRGLEHDLGRAVEGEVRFRPGDRALYTTGGSNYRQLPIGVVIPRTTDDLIETMRVCRDYRSPVLAPDGGRRGEIYAGLRDLRDHYADEIRARYPDLPRRVSGYNLDDLLPERGFDVAAALTGTEGTCALVLEASVHLIHAPPHRSLLVLGYDDEYEAADHVCEVLDAKPLGLEGVDAVLLEDMKVVGLHNEYLSMLPDGHGFLLVEFGGETKDDADEKAHKLMAQLKRAR